jgi:myo-inositol 2-dehydrogenase/D-chiro-inositol 1-dehydrogenase
VRIGIAGVGRIGALHAATLAGAGHELLLADLDAARAAQVAAGLTGPGGAPATARVVAGAAELFVAGVDALVVASATDTHAGLLRRALVEGVPVFCEKPVSPALGETIELAELERATGTFAQIGFQRRFDAGYRRARAAVESGELGAVHSVRAATLDNAPPPASYIAASGGIFADCCIHDFDVTATQKLLVQQRLARFPGDIRDRAALSIPIGENVPPSAWTGLLASLLQLIDQPHLVVQALSVKVQWDSRWVRLCGG